MTFIYVVDIVTSENSNVTKIMYLFLHNTCNMYRATIYLYSAKHRMRYDPEKIIGHCCKLHKEALSPFIRNSIFCCKKEFQKGMLSHYSLWLCSCQLSSSLYIGYCIGMIIDENPLSSTYIILSTTKLKYETTKTTPPQQ